MLTIEIYLALGVTIFVVLIQIIFFLKSRSDCFKLASLFPETYDKTENKILRIQDSTIDINTKRYLEELSESEIESSQLKNVNLLALNKKSNVSIQFREILDSTNKYLKNNIDTTAEFHILRDIAERISESEENKIASTISLPLYIGLMGTFIGVIFGIINIVLSGDGVGSSIITEVSIKVFLSGVFIAMLGSFVGLLLTTINNSYYFKEAKADRDVKKNLYFNFLQVELLPTLENSLGKNLWDFKENLLSFNKEFSVNINDFKGTIPAITDNLKQQTEFIQKFKEIDIPRLANANIEIFDKLNKSAELFKVFNNYAISINNNIMKADEILIKLTNLLDRMADFENNIKSIGVLVKDSEENYAKIGEYIFEKLSALRDRYQLIKEFVDKSEVDVKAIANESIDRIKALSQNLEQQFDNAFNFSVNSPFSKLELLDSVNKNLELILEKIGQVNPLLIPNTENEYLENTLLTLNNSINALRKSIRPSILKPVQYFKYIFSRNGNYKEL